jgi:hypothetical protein
MIGELNIARFQKMKLRNFKKDIRLGTKVKSSVAIGAKQHSSK